MRKTLTALLLAIVVPAVAGHGQTVARNTVSSHVIPESLTGPARKVMRLSDGRILASFEIKREGGTVASLYAASTASPAWRNVSAKLSDLKAVDVASDTGPAGTYVAFVDAATGTGSVARFPDPLGHGDAASIFNDLTPAGGAVTETFVAASKGEESTNSVAYAWRNRGTGEIYLGYSPDGQTFGKARVVAKNEHPGSGPILAVHNNYILLTYLSRDRSNRPEKVEGDVGFPVWMESWDGGNKWSDPKPLFGTTITGFPKAEEVLRDSDAKGRALPLYAAGGAQVASNALAWAQLEIGARIFITTEQALVTAEGRLPGTARPVAGLVSFKDLSDGPGAPWHHVFASEYNPNVKDPNQRHNTAFQYSALPGSSIRAVAYLQQAPSGEAREGDRIAVAVSINTGKSFDRTVKFNPASLGLGAGERLVFTTSTCLLLKKDGAVYLDAAYLDPKAGTVRVAQLPLGVNVKNLPPSLFNVSARWP